MTAFSCFLIGNEHLAVECGKRLLDAGHRIVAVVTHRAEIAAWATSVGLDVLDGLPALSDGEDQVDWLFSVANLEMIPATVLSRARSGAINFHDGPLPRYAGLNAPVWAIANAETTHGVTWHLMEEGADRGDVLVQRDIDIAPDETAFTLNAKCFAAGIESFDEVLEQIAAGLPGRRAQDFDQRSYFGRFHRPSAAGRLDFTISPETMSRFVRALDHGGYDNPVGSAWMQTATGPVLVAQAEPTEGRGMAGEILAADANSLTVAVSEGAVRLSGLTDAMGALRVPADVAQPGQVLPVLTPDMTRALEAGVSAVARNDLKWRARFNDYRPVRLSSGHAGGDGMAEIALDLHDADDTSAAAAFAAMVCLMSDGEQVDLALVNERASSVHTPWLPVRFMADGGWRRAREAFATEIEKARQLGPFAFDLPARIANLTHRAMPQAALGDDAAVEGAAITFLPTNGRLLVDTALIAKADADLIADRLSLLLSSLPHIAPDTSLDTLPMLPVAERNMVIDGFNRTEADSDDDLCIHHAFEARAKATPEADALVFETETLGYADLNARANRLAHVLIGAGITPGTPVGLHMRRGPGLVVAALAILKAGGAYVPLDPDYPADRIAFYAADSTAPVIISQSGLRDLPVPDGVERLLADTDPRIAEAPDTNPVTGVAPDDLAYLIYTSGSTGTPKGVMVEHRNVANFFGGMDDRIDHAEGGVFLAVTSLSFDISVLELFWTLSRGFKVVLLGDEKLVSGGARTDTPLSGGMDFSFFYWGNDDGVGRDKYGLLLEGAKFADENGFQAVWTPERHFHAFGGLYPNPSVTGAAVAAVTRNIAVRAGSCVAPLHHPARIAEEWSVIDNLTDGKTGLAIASGWHPDDFVLRPENAPPRNKAAVFEAIHDLRKLWAGEPLAMTRADGEVIEKVTQPRPVSKELEMWLTIAGNPDAWRQAGEEGVHVLTHLLGQSIEDVAQKIGIYHDALRSAGRDPKDYKVTLMLHTYLADTREAAMEVAREPMKAYLKAAADLIKQYAWAFPAFKRPAGVETPRDLDLGGLSDEEMEDILEFAFLRYFENSGLFGTVEDALERVAHVKSIGVTEVACLIDYGIERQTILDGLHLLTKVREASNAPDGMGDFSIAAQIARHGVTHLQCTPYMARMLVENDDSRAALGRLRHLLVGGEAFPAALARDLRAATSATVLNMYGPTETTIWSSTGQASDADQTVSVGRPIANTRFYVLNAEMQPVGVGQPGQLWIGGSGVARGYWERPDLTAEKFVDNPFHQGRIFGTGDQARWRSDGTLDLLGRQDSQIKIRGYRIEIGEIEAAMEGVAGVTQAVAVVRRDASGVGQLLGYMTGSADDAEVRAALAKSLPDFMIPIRIVTLDRFPLTPNRKIDRKALPDPSEATNLVSRIPAPTAPRPETEAAACQTGQPAIDIDTIGAIWAGVLGVPSVSPSDNFFDLGGHSLLAIEVHRRIKSELGVAGLSIADIFRAPTLAGLHGVIRKLADRTGPPRVQQAASTQQVRTPAMAGAAAPPVEDVSTVSKRRALRANRSPGR